MATEMSEDLSSKDCAWPISSTSCCSRSCPEDTSARRVFFSCCRASTSASIWPFCHESPSLFRGLQRGLVPCNDSLFLVNVSVQVLQFHREIFSRHLLLESIHQAFILIESYLQRLRYGMLYSGISCQTRFLLNLLFKGILFFRSRTLKMRADSLKLSCSVSSSESSTPSHLPLLSLRSELALLTKNFLLLQQQLLDASS